MLQQHHTRSGQLVLYLALLAMVVACMVALSLCDRPRGFVSEAQSAHSGGDTLDIAIEYSPVTYYTYDDTLGGYSYDLLRMIADSVGRPMKFHPIVTLQRALEGLDEGQYDVLVAQYPMTAHNRERYAFTQPIYLDQQVLVQRRGRQAIASQLDLAGDTVWVVKGSPMRERIASLGREIGDTIHVRVEEQYGPEQLMMMVAAGEIRYAVVNRAIATAMARRLPDIDCHVAISLSQFQSWVVAKSNTALCDSLNRWHQAVTRDTARVNQLQRRYFGATLPQLAR